MVTRSRGDTRPSSRATSPAAVTDRPGTARPGPAAGQSGQSPTVSANRATSRATAPFSTRRTSTPVGTGVGSGPVQTCSSAASAANPGSISAQRRAAAARSVVQPPSTTLTSPAAASRLLRATRQPSANRLGAVVEETLPPPGVPGDVAVEAAGGAHVGRVGPAQVGARRAGELDAVVAQEDPGPVGLVALAAQVIQLHGRDLDPTAQLPEPPRQTGAESGRVRPGQPHAEQVDVGLADAGPTGGDRPVQVQRRTGGQCRHRRGDDRLEHRGDPPAVDAGHDLAVRSDTLARVAHPAIMAGAAPVRAGLMMGVPVTSRAGGRVPSAPPTR